MKTFFKSKVVVIFAVLLAFSSCNKEQRTVTVNKATFKDVESLFPNGFDKLDDFALTKGRELHQSGYKETVYASMMSEYKQEFGQKNNMLYTDFIKLRKRLENEVSNGRNQAVLDTNFFSKAEIVLIENIRDELNTPKNEDELRVKLETCKKLINTNSQLSENQKHLLLFQLKVMEQVAFSTTSQANAKISGGLIYPTCKWWQRGCVFYVSTAQLPVLIIIAIANQYTELSALVAEFGINYIAQCCGFCGCNCPSGCPRVF
jgi:hypothetical protein